MKILDACCGSKMFWTDKNNPLVTFMDIRDGEYPENDRVVKVHPDVLGDFRQMDFADETFDAVIFDPPHFLHAGEDSRIAHRYGVLDCASWQSDLRRGFDECMRVLKRNRILIMKWNTYQISWPEVRKAIGRDCDFGDKRSQTRWMFFVKS